MADKDFFEEEKVEEKAPEPVKSNKKKSKGQKVDPRLLGFK